MALELLQKASTPPLQITEITELEEPKITDEEIYDIIKTYEIVLPRVPKLSREEEQDLFQQLEENPDGDSAREKLIDSNLKLVAHFARIIKNSNYCGILGFGDLFGEGYFGLLRAIEGFDWRLGYKFSTYAAWWIKQSIFRAIDNYSRVIRFPVHIQQKMRTYLRVQISLAQELGRVPSPKDIAERMNLSVARVEYLNQLVTLRYTFSLDKPLNEGNPESNTILQVTPIKTEGEEEIHPGFNNLRRDTILKVLNDHLTSKEKQVIILRFGLNDAGKPQTLEEVGKIYNLTRERIRQIEAKALRKLRYSPIAIKSLKDFVR